MSIRSSFHGWSRKSRLRWLTATIDPSPQTARNEIISNNKRPSRSLLAQEPAEQNLRARARHEAPNLRGARGILVRPHDRRTEPIWFLHDSHIRDHNPFPVEPNAIAPILRIPVDVLHACTVGKRAA